MQVSVIFHFFFPRDRRGNLGGAVSLAWLDLVVQPNNRKYCVTFAAGSSRSAASSFVVHVKSLPKCRHTANSHTINYSEHRMNSKHSTAQRPRAPLQCTTLSFKRSVFEIVITLPSPPSLTAESSTSAKSLQNFLNSGSGMKNLHTRMLT